MFDYLKIIVFVLASNLYLTSINAQLVINELSPDNASNFTDECGENPDWIEIYNGNNFSIDLKGFYLSDDIEILEKWAFPNITISPGDFLIIIADSKNIVSTYPHSNFKLSKDGETLFLSNENLEIIDEISFPNIPEDFSYGRTDSQWVILDPTPGEINFNEAVNKLNNVKWSLKSGFYENPIEVSLSSEDNGIIRYNINDKPNNELFEFYSNRFTINKTTSICAYAEQDGSITSDVICQTYFINTDHKIPVVNISGSNHDFFDSEDGIFSLGPNAQSEWPFWGANFWEDKELEIYIEYYVDEKPSFAQTAGLKMHGGRESRTSAMKSMRFLAKEKYGQPAFNQPVFKQKPNVTSYKKLVLRNASGDYNEAHLRDGYLQSHLINNKLNIDFNAYQAVAVYINGQYYGFMGLREKIDEEYLKSNYGLEDDDFDLLESDTIVIAGNKERFCLDYEYIRTHDLSHSENYEAAKRKFDIESFVDYFIAEISTNNTAWPNNNIRFWKAFDEDSRWRYLLFDMDIALGRHSWTEAHVSVFDNKFESLGDTNPHLNIFYALMENTEFKHYFLNRHQDIANTVFEFNYFLKELENHVDTIRNDMLQHFEKWDPPIGKIWESENIEIIKFYISQRPDYSKMHLIDAFDLDGSYSLDISVDRKQGFVKLNTLDSLINFHGYYFKNIPIVLTALENEKSEFAYWKIISNGDENIISDPKISLSLNKDSKVEAHFKDSRTSDNKLLVSYNNLSNQLKLKLSDNINLENKLLNIFDSRGQLIISNPISLTNNTWSILNVNINLDGIYFVSIQNEDKVYSNKIVIGK